MAKAPILKHILGLDHFSREDIEYIINGAEKFIPAAKKKTIPRGVTFKSEVTLLFDEPSTRTCGSYGRAARNLGVTPVVWQNDKVMSSGGKGESLADTARILVGQQGADILVLRTAVEGAPAWLAHYVLPERGFKAAVHNAGDGAHHHPTQVLLDLLTIKQKFGRLDNLIIGAVGDIKNSRVVHTLLDALSRFDGIKVRLVAHSNLQLPGVGDSFKDLQQSENPEILKDCDIVYAIRLQKERFDDMAEYNRYKSMYQVNQQFLSKLKSDVVVMDAMPIVDQISPNVRHDPRIIAHTQAWHGIPVRMWLLAESYRHRDKVVGFPEVEKLEAELLEEVSISDHRKELIKKKGQVVKPIDDGMVIDHLQSGTASILHQAFSGLGLVDSGKGMVVHATGLKSEHKAMGGNKDLYLVQNQHIPEGIWGLIAVLSPTATINVMRDGRFKKYRPMLPSMIYNIDALCCPNDRCVTNVEPEAKTRFYVYDRESSTQLECFFCNTVLPVQDAIR
ncbi:MAG: hypothetical protein COT81_01450 [Candidatus Buchananbacteria bacterium CG10_big_fil_rev_8_21_14_0_10_42_9]|uniref:Uncharacterized protein n=1 Tax=Candidatus Buchananbacteria bacterium CG10_big_fil_rev_8_21_14_0_10_42_9 TaxID=1974526 RepID=A0A2H0W299_9BACT|nr:MAG: hypothetical protein COT81_01450 [Candidatus Buchananbacteria bacterium CG10_big_fil_rev_8_21_14_0_10_42_9]